MPRFANDNRYKAGLLLLAIIAFCVCRPAMAVDFEKSIDAARKKDSSGRPLVLSFGAPWCGWCRKMDVDTFNSPEVKAISEKYLWVKVDVDEEPELSARYRVEGLPRTIVLDGKGRLIGSADGYMSATRFVKFLEDSQTKPLPNEFLVEELIEGLAKAEGDEAIRKSVVSLVEVLAKPNRVARDELLSALKQSKGVSRTVLLELMSDERLAIRAAAGSCLKHCLATDLEFDPFAEKETREIQLAKFQKAVTAPTDG